LLEEKSERFMAVRQKEEEEKPSLRHLWGIFERLVNDVWLEWK